MIDFLQNHNVPGVGSFFDFVPRGSKLALGGFNLYDLTSLVLLTDLSVASSRWQEVTGENQADDTNNLAMLLSVEQWGDKTLDQVLATQTEMVVNGEFLANVDDWVPSNITTVTLSHDVDRMLATITNTWSGPYQNVNSFVVGDLYRYSINYEKGTSTDYTFSIDPDKPIAFLGAGPATKTGMFTATAVIEKYYIRSGNSTGTLWVDDASMLRIPSMVFKQPNAPEVPKFYVNPPRINLDGIDDNMALQFAGGAGPALASVFCLVRSTSANNIIVFGSTVNGWYIFCGVPGDMTSSLTNLGGTILVNNALFTGTRDAFHTTITDGLWHLLENQDAVLSGLSEFNITDYSSYRMAGDLVPPVIIPNGQELTDNRDKIMAEMVKGYGITLA